jgi:long-chain acyl-CoA synthetase
VEELMANPLLMDNQPWIQHYDTHVPPSLNYPNSNLVEIFESAVEKNPDKRFISYNESTYSYKEISQLVRNLSACLIQSGLKKGDRVALMLPNIPQFIVAYFAILKAGGVVVALNPNYKLPEFEFLFRDSQPTKAICLERHEKILNGLNFPDASCIFVRSGQQLLQNQRPHSIQSFSTSDFDGLCQTTQEFSDRLFPEITPDDPAIFQYSGGTTGIPKAAIGSHRNIASNITQFNAWCNLQMSKETILSVIPLYHVYGMVLTMNLTITTQSEIVLIEDPSDTEKVLHEIEDKRVTFYPGVPSMFYAINQHPKVRIGKFDIRSIKACISGSAPLHPEIKAEFERLTRGKLVEGYGLSEAPTATHCNPVFGKNSRGSIGLPLPDVMCKVVDLETGEREVPTGELGELAIKGPQVMAGYHNQPEEDKIALREGWLYTGDVVRMDEEGYFYLIDRKKSLIKVSGFQVWPNEIELVILSYPGISACAVGGVPDKKQGEKVIAWVVKKPDMKMSKESIKAWCRERLVNYKVPSVIQFRKQLPLSGVGKMLRRELIREYCEKKTS